MHADRLVLSTTVYPAVAPYLPAWLASVRAQTDRDFDLCLAVDAMTREEALSAFGDALPARTTWLMAPDGFTPTGVRAMAIARLAAEYDGVVFADSDDLLHPDRVAAAREGLARADVTACALRIIDQDAHDLGIVFGPSPCDDPVAMLPRYNVFGLSNTAYRSSVLRACLASPERIPDTRLIDWLLATRAAALGATFTFDATPRMAYRQYATNIARVLPPFTRSEVAAATLNVLKHYECVLSGQPALAPAQRAAVCAASRRARMFYVSLAASAERCTQYVDALNHLPPRYVWWWCVANPELEELWSK